jgi:ABC-type branched-subunit amino acid transport system ATPase component
MPMPEPDHRDDLLVVHDLRRQFGGVSAVDGASFTASAGRITGLIGPNGAGKSTVLNVVAGALKPTSGSVHYRGRRISGLPPYRIARLGVIRTFQLSAEFSQLTVMENLLVAAPSQVGESLSAAVLGKWRWRRQEQQHVEQAWHLLDRFNMADHADEYAGNLSGGQKRLLELMRALMTGPDLLLLDEPMAGVNPTLSRGIERHLLELRDEGLSMLLVEHELGVVDRLCDPVIVMARGRVIAQGTMKELRADQEVLDAYLVG